MNRASVVHSVPSSRSMNSLVIEIQEVQRLVIITLLHNSRVCCCVVVIDIGVDLSTTMSPSFIFFWLLFFVFLVPVLYFLNANATNVFLKHKSYELAVNFRKFSNS